METRANSGVRSQGVQAEHAGHEPWIEGLPVCRTLSQHRIIHVGIHPGSTPIRVDCSHPSITYFLATFGGKGRVLINGQWEVLKPNHACLLPATANYAFESVPGSPWKFCWVCYNRPADQRPIAGAESPHLAPFETLPLQSAIAGLLHECNGHGQPVIVQEWTDLVHAYVMRFAENQEPVDSLGLLWERVGNHLAESWTLDRLAREAGYSCEHLRRLCRAKLGRSPMQQVTYLRMRRAAEFLAASEHTIEFVAHEVGYQNPFVFSNAFTKWMGWRPSEYRRKRQMTVTSSLKAA
jgi:AraC-like DNA-binding protein